MTKDLAGSRFRFGNFLEFDIDDIVEIIDHLRPNEQTITQFGMVSHDIFETLAASGRMVDRIVPVGEALSMSMQWDGKQVSQSFVASGRDHLMVQGALKRLTDVVLAALMLMILLPVPMIGCLTVLATMGRPVIFMHERSGKNGVPFRIIKLRTMLTDPDGKMTDSERVTRSGLFLRKYSVDEFPQLFNVLGGSMSLVDRARYCANMMLYIPLNNYGGFLPNPD